MQDAITNVINKSDVQGLYLDTASMTNLESYFASGDFLHGLDGLNSGTYGYTQ
jgi:hypothetical protein